MRILSLLTAAVVGMTSTAFAGNVPDDNQRHWEFNVAPQYVHEKIHVDTVEAGDKIGFKGSTYGLTASLATVMEDSWYIGVHGNWHTGKIKSDIDLAGSGPGSYTKKVTNDVLSGDLRLGYHFSMGQDLLEVGITPFVGVGYERHEIKIPEAVATNLIIISPKYTRGVGLVGFMSNYNWNESFSVGLNATLRASFSSEVKDKANGHKVGKLKNIMNGSIELPVGYSFQSSSMQILDSLNIVPFYNRLDWGSAKKTSTVDTPKITNKEYGVRLGLDLYF